jgi:tRNA (guanine9-N1)-methyltransferase
MMREQEEPEKASPLLAAAPEEAIGSTMSKPKRKKLLKQQRRLEIRKERKLKEKAANRARAEAQGRDLEAERQFLEERTATGERKRRLQLQWDKEKLPLAQESFQICLDCSFEKLMTEKEIASLAFQIRYCYSYNKKSPNPCFWAAASLSGRTLDLLEKETGYSEWVNRCYTGTPQLLEEYYKDNLQNVVYLTSDSDNTIEHLDNDKIYVIGGIVDRNRLKGIAMRRTEKLGIATAKLPLAEHLEMPTTRVLTCNHVFDILLKCREHDGDWSKALQQVLRVGKFSHASGIIRRVVNV